MKIGFIGAGKVSFSLGRYFHENNLELSGYYSNSYSSAVEGSIFTNSKAYKKLGDLVKDSQIIFVTTCDNAIIDCYKEISQFDIRDKFIINTSGSLSSKEFSNARELGAYSYSLHPIYPFSDKYNSYKNLDKCVFTLEGEENKEFIHNLIESLGNRVIPMVGEKSSYHLSCVMASNFMLALVAIAKEYLGSENYLDILIPLMEENLSSIKTKGLENSLTGPVVRGDEATIKKHIQVINGEHKELYKVLSEKLISLAIKAGGRDSDFINVESILEGM